MQTTLASQSIDSSRICDAGPLSLCLSEAQLISAQIGPGFLQKVGFVSLLDIENEICTFTSPSLAASTAS